MKYFFVFMILVNSGYSDGNIDHLREDGLKFGSYEHKDSVGKFDPSDTHDLEHSNGYTLKLHNPHKYPIFVGLDSEMREDIYRPCKLDDWACVREFFAAYSHCTKVYGPAPDPYHLKTNTAYLSVANITLILDDFTVTGLGNANINEFYVNKETGNVVLALEIKKLNHTAFCTFRYRRTAKESIPLSDNATLEFSSVILTAVIPKLPHLQLHKAEIHIDIQDPAPTLIYGPGLYASTDPEVVTGHASFLLNFRAVIQEGLLFLSQLHTGLFIQTYICDFGLKQFSI